MIALDREDTQSASRPSLYDNARNSSTLIGQPCQDTLYTTTTLLHNTTTTMVRYTKVRTMVGKSCGFKHCHGGHSAENSSYTGPLSISELPLIIETCSLSCFALFCAAPSASDPQPFIPTSAYHPAKPGAIRPHILATQPSPLFVP